jgi:hypothetical protein
MRKIYWIIAVPRCRQARAKIGEKLAGIFVPAKFISKPPVGLT